LPDQLRQALSGVGAMLPKIAINEEMDEAHRMDQPKIRLFIKSICLVYSSLFFGYSLYFLHRK